MHLRLYLACRTPTFFCVLTNGENIMDWYVFGTVLIFVIVGISILYFDDDSAEF